MTAGRIAPSPNAHNGTVLTSPPTLAGPGAADTRAGAVPQVECSVGVMAYNEEANIAQALESILRQELTAGRITEIIVVASGCEDGTCAIVADIASRQPRVRLIEQARREGKASAINLFIGAARSPVLVMVSADVIVTDGAFEALLRHFRDPAVGMVGGRPMPVNGNGTFLGHAVQLQWRLHDRIARETPKLGELVAFRNVVPSIPLDTAVDELSIQALVTQLGYRLVYERRSVVYNRGPGTLHDFLRQRRRIYSGHLRVREQQAYSAPTMSTWRAARALLDSESFATPQAALWSTGTVALEATARALGRYDIARGRRAPAVWEMCDTTKRHIEDAAHAQGQHNVTVFHIVNFHRLERELGRHPGQQLTRRVADRISQALGPAAAVSAQQAGTIVALMAGDREAAERAAAALTQLFEATPAVPGDRGASTRVSLTCGIIAFGQGGQPLSAPQPAPQPAPQLELGAGPAVVS